MPARRLLALAVLASLPGAAIPATATATGPSHITVRLRPVAVNAKGEVLMKTWREPNPEGARRPVAVDLGWLVVSASGLWKESTHRVDAGAGEARAWFERRLDWRSPPPSLRQLLAGHPFRRSDEVKPEEGAGEVTWTAERACVGERCTLSTVVQRTVGGLPAAEGARSRPECRFYRAGVAVLRNVVDGDGVARGAWFNHPGSAIFDDQTFGPQELGFSGADVDAVALVPEPALRSKQVE